MKHRNLAGMSLAAAMLLLLPLALAADTHGVVFERNVEVKMRDGIALRAGIYRPDAAGKFPVLLQRTPYDKNWGADFGLQGAAQGYVMIF
jgi:uncharacterized protein